ncbi:MAG: hypothetical protein AB7V40_06855 [Methyloceanibacter sp.]
MGTPVEARWNTWNRYAFDGSYTWMFTVTLSRGFWVVQTALTRVRPWQASVLPMATVGVVSAVMDNPPLFEVHPERWRGIVGGNNMTKVEIGLFANNCDVTAMFIAHKWG